MVLDSFKRALVELTSDPKSLNSKDDESCRFQGNIMALFSLKVLVPKWTEKAPSMQNWYFSLPLDHGYFPCPQ